MKISLKEVEQIAALARLELTSAEKQRYAGQLSDILDYAKKLVEVDTDSISPTASVLQMDLRMRVDQPRPGLPREELLHNAPETEDGQFKVPPVFGD